jgi:hypothetical protein
MPTRQVITLDPSTNTAGNLLVKAAYWLVAPTNRTVPVPGFTSQVPLASSVVPYGVTGPELALLRAGALVEQVVTIPITNSGASNATVQAALAAQFSLLQTTLTNQVFSLPHLVGTYWDGTTWFAGP